MPRGAKAPHRLLTTVLFTDIVGSTELAAKSGDKAWQRTVAAHHAAVRRDLKRFGGREVDTAGDGFFATFEQPSQAIRCAEAIVEDVRALGIEVRAGIHMGEVELDGRNVRGIAVHIGARVMSKAGPGQILVSSTVRDLMSGSDLRFDDLGSHELKGVPAEWRLYAVEQPAAEPGPVPGPGPAGPAQEERRRRVPWIAVALAAAVVAAAVAVPVVLTRGGAGGGSGAPAANTAVRLSADGTVQGVVPVGRDPLAVAADHGRIWLANFNDGTIQSVDTSAKTASPALALAVSAAPQAIAVGGGFVWVLSSTSTGELFRIDPTQAHSTVGFPVPIGVSGVAFGAGAVWVTSNFDDTVLRLDPQDPSSRQEVRLESGAGPKGVVVGAGAVWVAEGLKGKVARIDPRTLEVTSTVSLRGNPDQLAFGDGFVWATDPQGDSVTRISTSANPQGTTIASVGDDPSGISVGGGAVWVANAGDGTVARIETGTSNVRRISLGHGLSASGVAATPDGIWVTLRAG